MRSLDWAYCLSKSYRNACPRLSGLTVQDFSEYALRLNEVEAFVTVRLPKSSVPKIIRDEIYKLEQDYERACAIFSEFNKFYKNQLPLYRLRKIGNKEWEDTAREWKRLGNITDELHYMKKSLLKGVGSTF